MNRQTASLAILALFGFTTAAALTSAAQTATAHTPIAASAPTAVPALVPFTGTAVGEDAKPLTGQTTITFLIYKDEQAGEPLWSESQNVAIDATGHYKVQLGATSANGLPTDLFSTGEARWLEIQIAGQAPQSRVLLASVPYALKAGDATTFNGLPLSAFALVGANTPQAAALAHETAAAAATAANVTTTGGTTGYLPVFTGADTVADSILFSTSTGIGVGDVPNSTAVFDVNGKSIWRGLLNVSRAGTATASTGYDSYPMLFQASSYNSSTKAATLPEFELQAEPTGNNTATPGGTFNLLYNANSGTLAETGLSFNANGTVNFAPGQTFPGTGPGTITGVTAGTGLTGGGSTGNVALNVNQSVVAFQSDLSSAETTLNTSISAAQTNAVSTSEGYTNSNFLPLGGGSINGNVAIQGPPNVGNVLSVTGGSSQSFGAPGQGITLTSGNGGPGFWSAGGNGGSIALTAGSGGYSYDDTDTGGNGGQIVLSVGQAGGGAVGSGARGQVIVEGDDNGVLRTTPAQIQIQGASNSGKQLLIGYLSDGGLDYGYGAIQATFTDIANTPLLLNPNGGGVGIQTTTVTNSLTIGQGQGGALADAWYTYSSRRFKTDIQTLPDALDKVEKLRGVSYTLKATGKHEIGVIAEEVGKVVPEVVTYEKNGVDAQSVDYTRLTALLIEATKEQQKLIDKQAAQLETAIHQIKAQQAQIRQQSASLKQLRNQVQANTRQVHQISQQPTNSQPTLVASR